MVKRKKEAKVKNNSRKAKLIRWMRILSVLNIIIFSYLLFLHYSDSESFCDIAPGLSCDIVNKSPWSEFPPGSGIPVSLMGILTFIVVLFLLSFIKNNKTMKIGNTLLNVKSWSNLLYYLMIVSLLFSIYLIYTEAVYILSFCILCLAADIVIIVMLILSYKLKVIAYENKS